jgi:hypothetical protein
MPGNCRYPASTLPRTGPESVRTIAPPDRSAPEARVADPVSRPAEAARANAQESAHRLLMFIVVPLHLLACSGAW